MYIPHILEVPVVLDVPFHVLDVGDENTVLASWCFYRFSNIFFLRAHLFCEQLYHVV
jgi:hypothetical protein